MPRRVVKNRRTLIKSMSNPKVARHLLDVIECAISSVDPYKSVRNRIKRSSNLLSFNHYNLRLDKFNELIVIGFGKASGKMAEAIEKIFRGFPLRGVVSVPAGSASSLKLKRIEIVEAEHPFPGEGSLTAGEKILQLAKGVDRHTLIVALISGGGSSLAVAPRPPLTLEDLIKTNKILLRCGADIKEINTIRKHISLIKGGNLASQLYPSTVLNILVSDVPGDRLDTIASGPLVPDETTFHDALHILRKYRLHTKLPANVVKLVESGVIGNIPETPKEGDKVFKKVKNIIVASNRIAVEASYREAKKLGYKPLIISTVVEGEAREVAKMIVSIGKEVLNSNRPVRKPAILLFGGETTVTVKGKGKGGRNQEMALQAAISLRDVSNMMFLAIGTDGIDGVTDVAGGMVDTVTYRKMVSSGIDPIEHLLDNNSYEALRKVNSTIYTGPTGTNVNDIYILAVY